MKLLKLFYSIYMLVVFAIMFFLLFPLFFIFIQKESWHKHALALNRFWAKCFFAICFLPVEIEYREPLNRKTPYVFCPNHMSYLDIPIVGLTKSDFVFVGKNSMERIPLFGYMYRKLHITVDRTSLKSKYNTLVRTTEAVSAGRSVLMFPEGGILTNNPPNMAPFKDGPFRVAIEKKVPIVPVTIPFNWIILPDEQWLINWRRAKIIYHEPIETQHLNLDDLDSLKARTFEVIDAELRANILNASRQGDIAESGEVSQTQDKGRS